MSPQQFRLDRIYTRVWTNSIGQDQNIQVLRDFKFRVAFLGAPDAALLQIHLRDILNDCWENTECDLLVFTLLCRLHGGT
jgi:hypothetical protein